jgi:hypothetical protein
MYVCDTERFNGEFDTVRMWKNYNCLHLNLRKLRGELLMAVLFIEDTTIENNHVYSYSTCRRHAARGSCTS